MADLSYRAENPVVQRKSTDWGAIWAGLFTFTAIWSVFGLLGLAIFGGGAANPSGAQPTAGANIGLGIWTIVLTAVAMYIAGHETGRLAGRTGRYDGMVHGMVMFGLSVTAAMVLTMSGRMLFSGIPVVGSSLRNPYVLSGGSAWIAFVAVFLGWLGALIGASSGVPRKPEVSDNVRDMRPAA